MQRNWGRLNPGTYFTTIHSLISIFLSPPNVTWELHSLLALKINAANLDSNFELHIIVTSRKKFGLKTDLKQPHSDVRQASHHEVPVSLPWEQVHTRLKGEQVLLVHPTKQVQCHSEPVQFPPTCTLTMEQVQCHQNWQFNNHQNPLCPAPPSSTSPAS